MKTALPRALMALSTSCLGGQRHEWARAMQAEFEAAADEGKPMSFALGCLVAAWREMPAHEEGRFVLASYVLAIGLIVPAAALMLASIFAGGAAAHLAGDLLPVGNGRDPLLTEANVSAVPSLAVLVLLLAAGHLSIAWTMLERDWQRVAASTRLTAAITVTLAIFSGLVFLSDSGLIHAAVSALELAGIFVLARWHAELPLAGAQEANPHGF
jgi:hypothetical protein